MSAVESETQHIRDGSRIESCKYRLTHDGAAMSPVMSVQCIANARLSTARSVLAISVSFILPGSHASGNSHPVSLVPWCGMQQPY